MYSLTIKASDSFHTTVLLALLLPLGIMVVISRESDERRAQSAHRVFRAIVVVATGTDKMR
jgi:hypothetical protein